MNVINYFEEKYLSPFGSLRVSFINGGPVLVLIDRQVALNCKNIAEQLVFYVTDNWGCSNINYITVRNTVENDLGFLQLISIGNYDVI